MCVMLTGWFLARGSGFDAWLLCHYVSAIVLPPAIWYHVRAPSILLKTSLGTCVGLQLTGLLVDGGWTVGRTHVWARGLTDALLAPILRPVAVASDQDWLTNPFQLRALRLDDQAVARALSMEICLDLPATWQLRPGQYVLLWVGNASWRSLLQRHPFFVTQREALPQTQQRPPFTAWDIRQRQWVLYLRPRRGLTRRLERVKDLNDASTRCRTLVSGPFGHPPEVSHFDSVVMIAEGHTIVSMLPYLSAAVSSGCSGQRLRHVYLVWHVTRMGESCILSGAA